MKLLPRPGDTATSASVSVTSGPNFTSIAPVANSDACTVVVCVESKPRTPHQVTVNASLAASTKTRPPVDGSRSAKNGATRGGPPSRRAKPRVVDVASASSKVRLPSELTNTDVNERP